MFPQISTNPMQLQTARGFPNHDQPCGASWSPWPWPRPQPTSKPGRPCIQQRRYNDGSSGYVDGSGIQNWHNKRPMRLHGGFARHVFFIFFIFFLFFLFLPSSCTVVSRCFKYSFEYFLMFHGTSTFQSLVLGKIHTSWGIFSKLGYLWCFAPKWVHGNCGRVFRCRGSPGRS